jgi:hypothetical protein
MGYSLRDLLPGAKSCIDHYAKISPSDRVLIIFDNCTIADALITTARASHPEVEVNAIYIGSPLRPLSAMTKTIAAALRESTVVFSVFEDYDTEFTFRKQLLQFEEGRAGRKILHMPGVAERSFTEAGALSLNEQEIIQMVDLTTRIAILLTLAETVNISSGQYPETNLDIELGDTDNVASISTGIVQRGAWGNVPSGEAFVVPRSANGKIKIDKAISGSNLGFTPFALEIINSRAKVPIGETSPIDEKIRNFERKAKEDGIPSQNVRHVCEFGIGTNPKAQPFNFLEIEKILGTIHIAIGSNKIFGGPIDAPNHIDMVITEPTLLVDKKHKIMVEGTIDEGAIQDYTAIDHATLEALSLEPKDVVEFLNHKIEVQGDVLARFWTDFRGQKFSVPVGASESARLARQLWELCEGKKKEVWYLVSKFQGTHGGGDTSERQVHQLLALIKRFGGLKLQRPNVKDEPIL